MPLMEFAEEATGRPETDPVRIAIVDDHELVRLGTAQLIAREPGWSVCGEAGNAFSALTMIRENKPDLVLLDLRLGDEDGRANVSGSSIELLSDREIEVFQLLGRGRNIKEIARMLHIGPKTVEYHHYHIKKKAPSLRQQRGPAPRDSLGPRSLMMEPSPRITEPGALQRKMPPVRACGLDVPDSPTMTEPRKPSLILPVALT